MKRPLAFALLLAVAPARAGDTPPAHPLANPPKQTVPQTSGSADMTQFVRRLEDVGLETKTVRDLMSKISVSYRTPGSAANASWGYIMNTLYLPDSFKQSGTKAIRYDLASNEISTTIHELTHAAREFIASETAAPGTPAFEHYDAVKGIWGGLRSDAYFYRWGWWKADEVSGYFMGAAISEVFEFVDDIVLYNTFKGGAQDDPELGGKLLLPTAEGAKDDWEKSLARRAGDPFGRVSVKETAMFEGALIGWNPELPIIQEQMYRHILGLNPPRHPDELLSRLNTVDNEWIRGVRAKVLEARRKNAARR